MARATACRTAGSAVGTTAWAVANIALGFIYLLFGLRVFRVMTTITAVVWGAALGVMLGAHRIAPFPCA